MKNTQSITPVASTNKRSEKKIKYFAQFKVGNVWYYAEPPTKEYGQNTIEDCQTFIDYIETDADLRGAELLPYRIKEEIV